MRRARPTRRPIAGMAGVIAAVVLGASGGCLPATAPAPLPVVRVEQPPAPPQTGKRVIAKGPCRVSASSLAVLPDQPSVPLRLRGVDGVAFTLRGGRVSAELGEGIDPMAVPVEISEDGVSLSLFARAHDLPLRLKRAVVFEDFAIATPDAVVSWRGQRQGKLRVALKLQGGLVPDQLHALVPCEALTLDRDSFVALPTGTKEKQGRLARLRPDADVPLALQPGAAPVATLGMNHYTDEPTYYSDQVRELTFDGDYSRIVWVRGFEVVFGWIPKSALEVVPGDEPEPLYLPPPEDYDVDDEPDPGATRCPRDIDLWAGIYDSEREPVRVGSIAEGTGVYFDPSDRPGYHYANVMVNGPIYGELAVLLVRDTDIVDCKTP